MNYYNFVIMLDLFAGRRYTDSLNWYRPLKYVKKYLQTIICKEISVKRSPHLCSVESDILVSEEV